MNLHFMNIGISGIIVLILFTIIHLSCGDSQGAITINDYNKKRFNAGLRIIDFEYNTNNGKSERVTTAIWYPTHEKPRQYTYYTNSAEGKIESKVALDAPVASEGPYQLVLYAHGAFASGYSGAYFAEYLASRGYIIVGPDYIDTIPPDYTEQIYFVRIKGDNVANPLRVLKAGREFVEDMGEDRQFFLSYLAEHRFNHTSFIIDEMIRLNRSPESGFYRTIKESAIGICGHSEGGIAALGKTGAQPEEKFEDDRFKAALIFSAPGYPFENSADNIDVPVLFMVGDNDTPALHPEIPRRVLYDKAHPPKYYLVFRDATHFAFGNKGSGGTPLYEAIEDNPRTNAIYRYGLAFFEKYILSNDSKGSQLDKFDSALAYYVKETKEGKVIEWGQEPPSL